MTFFKRLFQPSKTSAPAPKPAEPSPSAATARVMLVSIGELTVGNDFLNIEGYPFEPSIAYRQPIIKANEIDEIDSLSYPPTIKVGNELIFLTREKVKELEAFALRNHIDIVPRPAIWSWILEPFLDSEYTPEAEEKAMEFLGNFGLTAEQIKSLRSEVEAQMISYN